MNNSLSSIISHNNLRIMNNIKSSIINNLHDKNLSDSEIKKLVYDIEKIIEKELIDPLVNIICCEDKQMIEIDSKINEYKKIRNSGRYSHPYFRSETDCFDKKIYERCKFNFEHGKFLIEDIEEQISKLEKGFHFGKKRKLKKLNDEIALINNDSKAYEEATEQENICKEIFKDNENIIYDLMKEYEEIKYKHAEKLIRKMFEKHPDLLNYDLKQIVGGRCGEKYIGDVQKQIIKEINQKNINENKQKNINEDVHTM